MHESSILINIIRVLLHNNRIFLSFSIIGFGHTFDFDWKCLTLSQYVIMMYQSANEVENLLLRMHFSWFQHTWTKSAHHLMQSKSSIQTVDRTVQTSLRFRAYCYLVFRYGPTSPEKKIQKNLNCIKSPRKFAFIFHFVNDKWPFFAVFWKKHFTKNCANSSASHDNTISFLIIL